MAHYTVELRKLIYYLGQQEVASWFSDYELSDYLTTSQIEVIENSGIWSKEKLATNITEWYYMREIGFDTPALFEHYAKATMKRLMEKYLPLIYSKCLEYNPLNNLNVTETVGKMGSETGQNQASVNVISSTSGSGLQVNSDTPQRSNIKRKHFSTEIMHLKLQLKKQQEVHQIQLHHLLMEVFLNLNRQLEI